MKTFIERRAKIILEAGLAAVGRKDFRGALQEFQCSANLCPTAEAYTYWGWMEFHLGDTERAIDLCKQAIEVDPSFGNPYNDIGSYLMGDGREDEAVPWFEQAIAAERYEPRQYPHLNLGRIYMQRREFTRALEHFEAAQRLAPEDAQIQAAILALMRLQKSLN